MATSTATQWALRGRGYEYCNCDFGCGCNFGGFPNSKDGSCRALVGMAFSAGHCGDVDLSGVRCAAIVAWPKAIHEGNGEAQPIVDVRATDEQRDAILRIMSGEETHGGDEIDGPEGTSRRVDHGEIPHLPHKEHGA